jgi:hypothetical protein
MVDLVTEGVTTDMLDVLSKQGLPINRSLDIELPQFPKDVTALDDQELMDFSTKYMANYNFILTQVTCAELAVTELEERIKFLEARLLIENTESGPKMTATLIKAYIATDPEITSLATLLMNAKAYHKLLKTMQDNVERYYQLTSRELTRRTSVLKARGY